LRGHAHRQPRAWKPLCRRRLCHRLACRARYCARGAARLAVPAAAGGGPVGGADRGRDRASAAAPVLSPRRGIPAARHLWPVANPRGSDAARLGRNAAVGRYADGCPADPPARRLVRQPQGGVGRSGRRQLCADRRHPVLPGARAGRALFDRCPSAAGAPDRPFWNRLMTADAQPLQNRSLLKLVAAAVPVLLALILVPSLVETYQLQLVIYGLIAAIAALGFNLLLGYTGLLSFGHSAYFGVGAYSVAFVVEHLGPHSMEFYLLVGIPIVAITSALFGY